MSMPRKVLSLGTVHRKSTRALNFSEFVYPRTSNLDPRESRPCSLRIECVFCRQMFSMERIECVLCRLNVFFIESYPRTGNLHPRVDALKRRQLLRGDFREQHGHRRLARGLEERSDMRDYVRVALSPQRALYFSHERLVTGGPLSRSLALSLSLGPRSAACRQCSSAVRAHGTEDRGEKKQEEDLDDAEHLDRHSQKSAN
jgi:hypothetical protein